MSPHIFGHFPHGVGLKADIGIMLLGAAASAGGFFAILNPFLTAILILLSIVLAGLRIADLLKARKKDKDA